MLLIHNEQPTEAQEAAVRVKVGGGERLTVREVSIFLAWKERQLRAQTQDSTKSAMTLTL